jgi:hypothetical protein
MADPPQILLRGFATLQPRRYACGTDYFEKTTFNVLLTVNHHAWISGKYPVSF